MKAKRQKRQTNDECWFCSKELKGRELVVEVVLKRTNEDGTKIRTLPNNPYQRVCLSCAIARLGLQSINEDNLDACAPKDWREHCTELALHTLERSRQACKEERMKRCIPKKVVNFVYKRCIWLDCLLYAWCKVLTKLTGRDLGY